MARAPARNAILRPREARALRIAAGFLTAGEDFPDHIVEAVTSAHRKLSDAPEQALWLPFSLMELDVLWDAITNGAEGVLQPSSGHRSDQRKAFRDAANRIAYAGGFGPKV